MKRRKVTLALVAATAVAGVGCAITDLDDALRCTQTSEFGNFGCSVVTGRVLDANAAPVAGALVGPSPSEDGSQFNTPYATTDSDGRFSLRLTRFLAGTGDSATVWIRAFIVPPTPEDATVRDSTLVRLRVAPLNAIPDTVEVELTLPIEP